MRNKGIFFDLYGTLLIYGDMPSAWSDWLSVFYDRLWACGLLLSKEEFAEHCHGFFKRPEPPCREDGLTVYERRIRAFGAELGLDLKITEVREVAALCARSWQKHISLDPDALPVLRKLKPKKTLALISNFDHPPHVHALLSELGLVELFEAIVISGEAGSKKPDPQIFALALQRTALRPHEVVYVGDTAEDIRGARAAGICPILIQRNESSENRGNEDFSLNREDPTNTAIESINGEVRMIYSLSDLHEVLG